MKTMNKKVLYAIGFVVIVTGYTWISVVKNTPEVDPNARLGSDMPLDLIHQNEKVPDVSLSKTEVYLNEEKVEQAKMRQFEETLSHKDPQKLTSAFTETYQSPYDKRMHELKSRDLTATYAPQQKPMEASYRSQPVEVVPVKSTPQIKKASVPVKRNVELQESAKPSAVDEMSYFNMTSVGESSAQAGAPEESTMVKAAVLGNQEVKPGGFLKFRLLEQATFNGVNYPRNTIITGVASLGNDRLFAKIDRITTKSGYMKISLELHDQDLMRGIYVPFKAGNETATDEALTGVEDILNSTGTVAGSAGSGIARIFRSSVNGQQKVSVTDGFPVLFVIQSE